MNNILVGNLSPNTTEQDIRCIFGKHGKVKRLKMMTDLKTDQPRGFAFVEMSNDTEAGMAIAATDGAEVSGRSIKVSAARPQIHRKSPEPRK